MKHLLLIPWATDHQLSADWADACEQACPSQPCSVTGAKAPLATEAGPDVRATVLSIGDDDTFRVLEGGEGLTIRLACIDAPEKAQSPDGANARS